MRCSFLIYAVLVYNNVVLVLPFETFATLVVLGRELHFEEY